MKLTLLALFGLIASGSAMLRGSHSKEEFDAWRLEHGYINRFTTEGELEKRFKIWSNNMDMIEEHNSKNLGWTMKMNEFGHLTGAEFKEMYTGINHAKPDVSDIPRKTMYWHASMKSENPTSVDWTTKGAVTPVKNQGSCGSCWSFSTTGSLEGAYFLKNNKLVSFSEQQLVSCDTNDSGCNGGLMDNAFKWIKNNGGLCTESDYPYTSGGGSSGMCQTSCQVVEGSIPSSYTDVSPVPQITPATVAQMESAVSQQPISVAIEADQSSFQFYSGGVMTGNCGTQLDHGVLVVGYGTDNGTDYWKIKNSWGASWGMNGYILIQKGNTQRGGQCGVLLAASHPNL